MLSILALISLVLAVETRSKNPSTRPCSETRKIIEYRELSSLQKQSYWKAVKCLRQKPSKLHTGSEQTLWEDLVEVHDKASPQVHNTAQFLPWHRYFLTVYYNFLETECQYNGPGVYWDWTVDSQAPDRSTIWDDFGDQSHGCVNIPAVGLLTSNVPSKHCVTRRWTKSRHGTERSLMGAYYCSSAIFYVLENENYDNFRQRYCEIIT
jgi:hypothetical protein